MRIGTSYFISRRTAVRYYKTHGGFTKKDVNRKIEDGEIHIGQPPLKPGQRLVLIDRYTRYAIEEGK
jgi:hypothetical protein